MERSVAHGYLRARKEGYWATRERDARSPSGLVRTRAAADAPDDGRGLRDLARDMARWMGTRHSPGAGVRLVAGPSPDGPLVH